MTRSDGRRRFHSERDLAHDLAPTILPHYEAGARGTFAGRGGVPIDYRVFAADPERAALVLVAGRRECHARYAELIWDLRRSGYSIYLYDHRGQGFSGRLLSDPQRGHVDAFEHYVDDLATFVDTVVGDGHRRLFGLAHSMGGVVLGHYLLRQPGRFDAVVMTAPMLALHAGPLPGWAAERIARALPARWYAPREGPYDPAADFADQQLTHSRDRFEMDRAVTARYAHHAGGQGIAVGGATLGWLAEALRAVRELRAGAHALRVPLLLIAAGAETRVDNRGLSSICARAPSCRLVTIPYAGHEILFEVDALRDRALDHALGLYAQHDPR